MPSTVVIIPARLASTRFPNKVLADRTGKPLIQHVAEAAARAKWGSTVVVAADDQRVRDALTPFKTRTILTRVDHPNGTSRLAEAADLLALESDDIIVNAQGDEPELEPALLDAAVDALHRTNCPVATAAVPFQPGEDPANPNLVKVVTRADGRALYFSRALIPHQRDPGVPAQPPLKHVGLYVYRRWFLARYAALAPAPIENTEMLEQLRVLHWGFDIAVAVCNVATHGGIDTPEQYDAFVRRHHAARA